MLLIWIIITTLCFFGLVGMAFNSKTEVKMIKAKVKETGVLTLVYENGGEWHDNAGNTYRYCELNFLYLTDNQDYEKD